MPDTYWKTTTQNSRFYLMEAAGIAGFVFLAGSFTILLEHPNMPAMKTELHEYPFLRRALLGVVMGLYVAWTIKLFGKLSGTHVNPATTWTFFRLGNITFFNTVNYITAQFIGAILGFYLLKWLAGNLFSHPLINYGVSKPHPPYSMAAAFTAEFIISFLLMFVILVISSSRKWESHMAIITGILLALFITFELPFSGMSMNPARSFAAALGANQWNGLWIYFVSPVAAMLAAAELFIIWKKKRVINQHPDHKEVTIYPSRKAL